MEWPKFLKLKEHNQRRVSIDFGASFIKVVCLEASNDSYRLLAYALGELNPGEKSIPEISQALVALLGEHKIVEKNVALSISDPDWIFIKKLSLPQMPKDELLAAVKWQLKGQIPFNADESLADLQIIREYTDSDGAKKVELFCVFAKKEIIDKYVAVTTQSGLSPVKVSSSVFNYCGILNLLPDNPAISAILDVGHTHSQLSIYQKNKLSFVRDLNFSTEKLNSALVGTLATDSGKLQIDARKADELLAKMGIPLDDAQVSGEGIKANQIISLIRPLLENITKELSRSFDYFKAESALELPTILYITGGGANLKNFANYLADNLSLPVEQLPLPGALETKKINSEQLALDTNQISSAVALSLSSNGINLLPREIKNLKSELLQKTSLRIGAVVITAVLIFSWSIMKFQIGDYKKRLMIAKAHLQSVEEVKDLKSRVDLREELINIIHTGKVPSGGLLKLISAVIPPSIILNEFGFDQSSHAMWLSGVVISGNDSVEKTLTDFMKALEDSNFIDEASLVRSKEDQGINNFEIKCELAK